MTRSIYILLEYLGFGFLSLVDLLSGLGSAEDSSIISDVTGGDCSATGDSGASSGTKEPVSPEVTPLFQVQLLAL